MVEGHRWSVRVGTADDLARLHVRTSSLELGAPVTFDSEYPHVTALEAVLGAVGADLVGGLRAEARRRRIALDEVEAVVGCELVNPLTHIGVVGEEGHPGIRRLEVKVYASTAHDEEALQPIWERVLARSPLICTLRDAVELVLELKLTI